MTPDPLRLDIPDFSLVVLIGPPGAGKSAFAARWFAPSEVISFAQCQALISDPDSSPSADDDVLDVVRVLAEKRLKHRLLAVIDCTSTHPPERKLLVALARRWHAPAVAIMLDPGLEAIAAHGPGHSGGKKGRAHLRRLLQDMHAGFPGLRAEGFRAAWMLDSPQSIAATAVRRVPLPVDQRGDEGPFDIVGDVHGCADELEALLEKLGYQVTWHGTEVTIAPPDGRKLVFVGDLVDRGPRTPDVLRIAMATVAGGHGYVVDGNHDEKLARWMAGRDVKVVGSLRASIEQLAAETGAFRQDVKAFLDSRPSHCWLAGGKLVVAHAGLKAEMIGRESGAVRAFALYGETNGETDQFGLPVRLPWANAYRGTATIVYGHTPMLMPKWNNNTLCVDTGCVFGGSLTALRWPENDIVSVPAARVYSAPVRPLSTNPAGDGPAGDGEDDRLLDLQEVSGRHAIETTLMRSITVGEEGAAAAIETMDRFAVAPQWIVHLPPALSPVDTGIRLLERFPAKWDRFAVRKRDYAKESRAYSDSNEAEYALERPEEALAYYRAQGQSAVVVEEMPAGSRVIIAVCRDEAAARRRFGTAGSRTGAIWGRSARPWCADPAATERVLAHIRATADAASLWDELRTDWLLIDAAVTPPPEAARSVAEGLLTGIAGAARAGFAAADNALARAARRGIPVAALRAHFAARAGKVERYAAAMRSEASPETPEPRVAAFHLLASEGAVHFDRDHPWHLTMLERLAAAGAPTLRVPAWRLVPLDDAAAGAAASAWWEDLTSRGGAGIVVKPVGFVARGTNGLIQPALKVRSVERLRTVYGPEYDLPDNLSGLRQRGLARKRSLALRQFALGHEALTRFVARHPLRKIHECVMAIMALESEPVDPRL